METQKTALVLSAGGMFGAYQAGVYRALRRYLDPDLVVGASVGALNGWAIASGCAPERLVERWLDPSTGGALRLFPNHGWRNGWLDPAPLRAQAEALWREYRPSIPFGLVVVEFGTLRTRLVRHPEVLPEHLHATCSIPLFLPMVKIAGRRFMDGAFFEKLPIWAALEMGATRIIAVDSLPNVGRWWVHAGIALAKIFAPRCPRVENIDVTVISPSERLGGANDAVFWAKENIARWIELGERDAHDALGDSSTLAA